jgi:hypothetical protein
MGPPGFPPIPRRSQTFFCTVGVKVGWSAVKLIAEFLERAHEFEGFAGLEHDPQVKADLQRQAAAYRKLAVDRGKELGLEPRPAGETA